MGVCKCVVASPDRPGKAIGATLADVEEFKSDGRGSSGSSVRSISLMSLATPAVDLGVVFADAVGASLNCRDALPFPFVTNGGSSS